MPAWENERVSDVAHADDALAAIIVGIVVASSSSSDAALAVGFGRVDVSLFVLDAVNFLQ